MATSKSLKVNFAFERETKGAVRFQEQDVKDGDEPVIGTLYLRKKHLGGSVPKNLTVTIEVK